MLEQIANRRMLEIRARRKASLYPAQLQFSSADLVKNSAGGEPMELYIKPRYLVQNIQGNPNELLGGERVSYLKPGTTRLSRSRPMSAAESAAQDAIEYPAEDDSTLEEPESP